MVWIGTKGSYPAGRGRLCRRQNEPYPVPPQREWGREEVHKDWVVAVKAGKPAPCHFVALRVGHRIDWDPLEFRITNCREANQYLYREYRKG
jgi:hypothetical protein